MRSSARSRCFSTAIACFATSGPLTTRDQAASPPACLALESQAFARPGPQLLQLEQASRANTGRLRWRTRDRITTAGRWRWQHDTLYLDVESTWRLPGARGALDPRGARFRAALVPVGSEWRGTGHQDVPGVERGIDAPVQGRPCPQQ